MRARLFETHDRTECDPHGCDKIEKEFGREEAAAVESDVPCDGRKDAFRSAGGSIKEADED